MHPIISAANPMLLQADIYMKDKYNKTASVRMLYKPETDISPDYTAVESWATDFHAAVGAEIDDIIDVDTAIVTVKAVWWKYAGNIEIQAFSTGDFISGTMGGVADDGGLEIESLPPTDALIIRKVTGYSGRQNTGRLFVPFISEQVQHDGIWDDLNKLAVQQICGDLMTPPNFGGNALIPVLWNRKETALIQIIQMKGMSNLGTRRDRRRKGLNIPF